jgi:DNA-binding LacI/PurR family transcriptional regulator
MIGGNLPAGGGVVGGYGYAATLAPPASSARPLPLSAEAERAAARLRARSRTLGMGISPAFDLLDPNEAGPSHLADLVWHGASRMAEWDDYRLLSYPASVRNAADPSPFLDGSVAGLILTGGYEDPRPARLAEAGLPVVLLGRFLDIPDGCGAVYALERDTVDLAMNHLQELGHRVIAHYAGPVKPAVPALGTEGTAAGVLRPAIQYAPSDVAIQRRERYLGWMRMNAADACGDDPAELVFADDSWRGERAAEALSFWMSLPEEKRPTAVFCASDALALRLMEAALAAGISIPDDISIVGVDDSPAAATAPVPLTSVAIPGEQIGREAVRLLLRMIEGIPPVSCRLAVPVTRISVRASTAAPAASAAPRVALAAAA